MERAVTAPAPVTLAGNIPKIWELSRPIWFARTDRAFRLKGIVPMNVRVPLIAAILNVFHRVLVVR